MANWYCRSLAVGTGVGTSWTNAAVTLTATFALAVAAGDTIWVADDHSETTAATITLTSPGTAANPCRILCGNRAAEPPTALTTTAKVATTGNSGIDFNGFGYWYGIEWEAGSGATAGSSSIRTGVTSTPFAAVFEQCLFDLNTTGGAQEFRLGPQANTSIDDTITKLINCSVEFGSTGQKIDCQHGNVHIIGGFVPSGSVPTTLFITSTQTTGVAGNVLVEAADLSHAGGNITNLVSVASNTCHKFLFRNCKLDASITLVTGTHAGPGGTTVTVINCDSGDTNYAYAQHDYLGSIVSTLADGTDIVRSGGASDGTNPISWKMVSSANTKFWWPLISPVIAAWNNTTGAAITATVHYAHGHSSTLQNDDIWMEVEHLGTSGVPLAIIDLDDRVADVLTAAADQDSGTAQDWDDGATAWVLLTAYSLNDIRRSATPNGRVFIVTTAGTSGAAEPAAFGTAADGDSVVDATVTWRAMRREKMVATFTPQEIGNVIVRVHLADPSRTVWVDPLLVLT